MNLALKDYNEIPYKNNKATMSTIQIIPADEFRAVLTDTTEKAFKFKVDQFIVRCNNAIKTRIEDIKRNPQRTPENKIVVSTNHEQTKEVLQAVKKVFMAQGYTVQIAEDEGYDDGPGRYTPPSTCFVLSV